MPMIDYNVSLIVTASLMFGFPFIHYVLAKVFPFFAEGEN